MIHKMLYCDKIEVSKVIDINKTSAYKYISEIYYLPLILLFR